MTHVWRSFHSNEFIYLAFGEPNGWGYSFICLCLRVNHQYVKHPSSSLYCFCVCLCVCFPCEFHPFQLYGSSLLSDEITCSISSHSGEDELLPYLCLFCLCSSITPAPPQKLPNTAAPWMCPYAGREPVFAVRRSVLISVLVNAVVCGLSCPTSCTVSVEMELLHSCP